MTLVMMTNILKKDKLDYPIKIGHQEHRFDCIDTFAVQRLCTTGGNSWNVASKLKVSKYQKSSIFLCYICWLI